MSDEFRRILIYFEKDGEALPLSHLELMRAFEDAVVESGLPVRLSGGENPRPKLGFATALPRGMASRCETVEIPVRADTTVGEVLRRIAPCLPPGLRVRDGDWLYAGERVRIEEMVYEIGGEAGSLPDRGELEELLALDRVPVTRRKREVDLKPLLTRLERDGAVLLAGIRWTDSGTARPGDVLTATGRDPDAHPARKVGVSLTSSLGERLGIGDDA